MINTIEFIKNQKHSFILGFIILTSIFAIIFILPRQKKFRYEFQKGMIWKHNSLKAPFDFPIYKTDSKLKSETDSVIEKISPYYYKDTATYKQIINKFNSSFNKKSQEFDLSREVKDEIYLHYLESLNSIYNKGIVNKYPEYASKSDTSLIIFEKTNDKFVKKEVLTQKQAYLSLADSFFSKNKYIINKEKFQRFIKSWDINQMIEPNLIFDEETTNKVKDDAISDLSIYKGMVQSGQLIISEGEPITDEKYQILNSLKQEYEKSVINEKEFVILGQFIIVGGSILLLILFMLNFRIDILRDTRNILFIYTLITLNVVIASILIRYTSVNIYIIPFAIIPIIIRTFYDARIAQFVHLISIFIIGFFVPNSFEFVFLTYFAGVIAIFSLSNQYRRSRFFLSSAFVLITYTILFFAISIIQGTQIANIDYTNLIWFSLSSLLLLLSLPLIYVFEKIFGFLSDATLIELSDTNHPLLRKLAEIAPGTFQHSMQVANLAEEAARQIGANPLLVRAGALYHDIGKTEKTSFFTENQDAKNNPHEMLEFDESAKIIISHAKKGAEIAKKYKLPQQIIDFILTHHGTTTVKYFYKSFQNKYPGKEINVDKFKYPGPKPKTKETSILMMADSVEAASRSLSEYTEEKLNNLIDSIISDQTKQDQFFDSDITFKDISIIKEIFKMKLKNIYHGRIKYPGQKD